jgi:hypothetical protein
MTQITFGKNTKFFRSFTATTMPIVPIDEISPDDIDNHVSFYAADFDDGGRLIRCRKFLNVEDAEGNVRNLVFDDQYAYSTVGCLESRTLVRADGKESHWFFDTSTDADLWRDFVLAQDELTEIESRAMSSVWASDMRGNEFAVASVRQYLTSAEQVLRAATQDPAATIGMLIPRSEDEWQSLHPSDDLIPGDIDEVLMPHMLECELPFVCASATDLSDALSEGSRVFRDNQIRALAAQPVRVKDEEVTRIGVIVMLARRDWAKGTAEPVMSVLKRIAVFVELLLELGLRENSLEARLDANSSPPD